MAPARGAAEQHWIYRTHDAGKTWTRIVNGLPTGERTGSQVHVLREDPKQKGLLFVGTETTVFVSFDDGDHWQSLRLNLPSTSIRDMVFHTDDHMNDLVIGTYGRGFWVLDDMSPLRDIAAKGQEIASAPAYLFKPGDAIRARMNSNWDQPLNPELFHAPNPPFGALLYYHLSKPPAGEIKIQIFDSGGKLVRTLSSNVPPAVERPPYPDYWLMPPQERALSTAVGTNRINWDLRYDDPPGYNADINNQMNSSPGMRHARAARSAGVARDVHAQAARRWRDVHADARRAQRSAHRRKPRGDERAAGAERAGAARVSGDEGRRGRQRRGRRRARAGRGPGVGGAAADLASAATALDAKLATFGGATGRGGRGGGGGGGGGGRGGGAAPGGVTSFTALNGTFNALVELNHNGLDMAPTKAQINTWENDCKDSARRSSRGSRCRASISRASTPSSRRPEKPALEDPAHRVDRAGIVQVRAAGAGGRRARRSAIVIAAGFRRFALVSTAVVAAATSGSLRAGAQDSGAISPALYADLTWRCTGPFDGGPVASVEGVAGEPGVYTITTPSGSAWKTTDGGDTWTSIERSSAASISGDPHRWIDPANPRRIARTEPQGIGVSLDGGGTWVRRISCRSPRSRASHRERSLPTRRRHGVRSPERPSPCRSPIRCGPGFCLPARALPCTCRSTLARTGHRCS